MGLVETSSGTPNLPLKAAMGKKHLNNLRPPRGRATESNELAGLRPKLAAKCCSQYSSKSLMFKDFHLLIYIALAKRKLFLPATCSCS